VLKCPSSYRILHPNDKLSQWLLPNCPLCIRNNFGPHFGQWTNQFNSFTTNLGEKFHVYDIDRYIHNCIQIQLQYKEKRFLSSFHPLFGLGIYFRNVIPSFNYSITINNNISYLFFSHLFCLFQLTLFLVSFPMSVVSTLTSVKLCFHLSMLESYIFFLLN
jgi:hypothetical protein